MKHPNLYIARKVNRMSQKQVAKKIGLSHSSYSKKERGVAPFSLKEAQLLASMFGSSIDYLFQEKERVG